MNRPVREPGPDHPILIDTDGQLVRLKAKGVKVGEGVALALREASYPPVFYIERGAINAVALTRSEKTTWCPYKGEATHYHLTLADGTVLENAIWSYEDPLPAVDVIKNRLAFYPVVTVEPA
ncbi:DUF427 domain-containing protein [Hyphobacterium sp.]|uniref:DUF427 domain-containing protein n=1 Tax=Hyphobacterium sp. TaxID=2004662 RepID=UPI003BADA0FF